MLRFTLLTYNQMTLLTSMPLGHSSYILQFRNFQLIRASLKIIQWLPRRMSISKINTVCNKVLWSYVSLLSSFLFLVDTDIVSFRMLSDVMHIKNTECTQHTVIRGGTGSFDWVDPNNQWCRHHLIQGALKRRVQNAESTEAEMPKRSRE